MERMTQRKGSTLGPAYEGSNFECPDESHLCENGNCIPKTDICPEEMELKENTLIIMSIVGAVMVFVMILYIIQRKCLVRDRNGNASGLETIIGDNSSFNLPPPSYNEVINTDLYPPTPNMQRSPRTSASEEPITPPPNYDTALHILARSHQNVYAAKIQSPVIRRSVSSDLSPSSPNGSSRVRSENFQRVLSSPEERF